MAKDRRAIEIERALSYIPKEYKDIEVFSNAERMKDNIRKAWYRFSRNKLSVIGLSIVILVILLAVFAKQIIPYPNHVDAFTDFTNAKSAPSLNHLCGTDDVGRDILSRIIFAFRSALLMAIVVLTISVPIGVFLGLLAGYKRGSWLEMLIMRITDVFLSVPALLLALAVASVLEPSLINAMFAITVMWWPWYTRLVYGMANSYRNENYVVYSELIGASSTHIIFKEILPNCFSPIFTKVALDVGWVIMMDASLSFVGLGIQPPRPSLGQMVSSGMAYLPECWWMTVGPSVAIIIIILGFNFLGDGIRDMLSKGVSNYD
ncbi:MAG: ABC transporter permease [Saccharofermentanales bacterium]|jgi:peptide/nickel transport system permease protein|nr:ABC transporter permease [Bacillota bacterium]